MTNFIFGVGQCYIDGVNYQVQGDVSINPTVIKYEPKSGFSGNFGAQASYMWNSVEMNLWDNPQVAISQFQNMTASTISVELISGKSFVFTNAIINEVSPLNAVEGTFKVKFSATTCDELVS